MKQNDHVVSKQLSMELNDLGVPQNSQFYWCEYTSYNDERELTTDWILKDKKQQIKEVGLCVSAFLSSELGEILKKNIDIQVDFTGDGYRINYLNRKNVEMYFWHTNLAEAIAKMLIYLLTNNLIQPT